MNLLCKEPSRVSLRASSDGMLTISQGFQLNSLLIVLLDLGMAWHSQVWKVPRPTANRRSRAGETDPAAGADTGAQEGGHSGCFKNFSNL